MNLSNNSNGNIIKKAYSLLYQKECPYICVLKFSSRFHDYGATISLKKDKIIEFRASRTWLIANNGEGIDEDIFIGLVQHLLLKLFGNKKENKLNTFYLELYDSFIYNIDKHDKLNLDAREKKKREKSDPLLLQSFNKLNEYYFFGTLEKPFITFGKEAKTQMGKYDFRTDTITINKIFKKPLYFQHFKRKKEPNYLFFDKFDINLIVDSIIYHEMLHKKLKFKTNNSMLSNGARGNGNRTNRRLKYHTKEFRRMEKKFDDWYKAEKQMNSFIKFTRNPLFKSWLHNPKDIKRNQSNSIERRKQQSSLIKSLLDKIKKL